jgi:DnaA-homolog protein
MMQQLVLELAPPAAPTLENFFPGANSAALAALRHALAGTEPVTYLWGESGSGKTHLLRAAAAAAAAQGDWAVYVCAPHGALASLAECGALVVDDVDALDAAAQLALFDACNALRGRGGWLVAAGARPLADLALREDLRTRLASGLSLRLAPLSDEEKAAALSYHAAQRGLRLGSEVIAYVLTHCRRDMGTQIALLDALDRLSLEQKRPVTLPLLRDALRAFEQ